MLDGTAGTVLRTADHALAWRGLQPNLNFAKEYVEFRLNGRRIALMCDSKLSAVISIDNGSRCSIPHIVGSRILGKVKGRISDAQGSIVGTIGLIEGIAARPGLRSDWTGD